MRGLDREVCLRCCFGVGTEGRDWRVVVTRRARGAYRREDFFFFLSFDLSLLVRLVLLDLLSLLSRSELLDVEGLAAFLAASSSLRRASAAASLSRSLVVGVEGDRRRDGPGSFGSLVGVLGTLEGGLARGGGAAEDRAASAVLEASAAAASSASRAAVATAKLVSVSRRSWDACSERDTSRSAASWARPAVTLKRTSS